MYTLYSISNIEVTSKCKGAASVRAHAPLWRVFCFSALI